MAIQDATQFPLFRVNWMTMSNAETGDLLWEKRNWQDLAPGVEHQGPFSLYLLFFEFKFSSAQNCNSQSIHLIHLPSLPHFLIRPLSCSCSPSVRIPRPSSSKRSSNTSISPRLPCCIPRSRVLFSRITQCIPHIAANSISRSDDWRYFIRYGSFNNSNCVNHESSKSVPWAEYRVALQVRFCYAGLYQYMGEHHMRRQQR